MGIHYSIALQLAPPGVVIEGVRSKSTLVRNWGIWGAADCLDGWPN